MDNSEKLGFFPSLVTTLFIGLKLTSYITWSWWWVLAPLWVTVTLKILFQSNMYKKLERYLNNIE